MCLHDMDDLAAVLTEASRVLQVGGHLVLALVHPLNSAGAFDRTDSSSMPAYVIHDAYTEERHYTDVRTRNGLSMTYNGIHRPLHAYTTALSSAGFSIQQLREISSDEPDNKWLRVPLFCTLSPSDSHRYPDLTFSLDGRLSVQGCTSR